MKCGVAALTLQRGSDRTCVAPRDKRAGGGRPKPRQPMCPCPWPRASCPWPPTPAKDDMWVRRPGKPAGLWGLRPCALTENSTGPWPRTGRAGPLLPGRKLKGKVPTTPGFVQILLRRQREHEAGAQARVGRTKMSLGSVDSVPPLPLSDLSFVICQMGQTETSMTCANRTGLCTQEASPLAQSILQVRQGLEGH